MRKTMATQFKEVGTILLLSFTGLGLMVWGANMTRAQGFFVFFPGGLIALAGVALVASAFYYHYRKDFRKTKGGKAFARYIALAAVNGFLAMIAARLLFRG